MEAVQPTAAALDGAAAGAVFDLLDALTGAELEFVDLFYQRLFARFPDVRSLFGEYSLSEQREMVLETFRSILGWIDEEPWVDENLAALGSSHAEYGVEAALYGPFVDLFVEVAAEVLGSDGESAGLDSLRVALEFVSNAMSAAGEVALANGVIERAAPTNASSPATR